MWQLVKANWYEDKERYLEITSGTAVWFHTRFAGHFGGKAPVPIRWLLIRDPLGELDAQALLCTDPEVVPEQIIAWFILRWRLEVTFQEVRAHLGVETQRQWSDLAIARTTPALFGLFSLVTLAAHELYQEQVFWPRRDAWYCKTLPTFSDALATLRESLAIPRMARLRLFRQVLL